MTPTDEQLDILNSHDNVMIESLAGCGKTSTLIMLEASLPSPILFLAFNKWRKAEEQRKKEAGECPDRE